MVGPELFRFALNARSCFPLVGWCRRRRARNYEAPTKMIESRSRMAVLLLRSTFSNVGVVVLRRLMPLALPASLMPAGAARVGDVLRR